MVGSDLGAVVDQVLSQLPQSPVLYVGLSGGVDSTALLLLCEQWARRANVRLVALHANHGLQASADAWQQHCQALCDARDIELISATLNVPKSGNLEAQAREHRYAFFKDHVTAPAQLALAHHGADQSETALLRLFQGRGLMAMQTVSTVQGIGVVRPLLAATKADLIVSVQAAGVAWVEDTSNQDVDLDRNYLRHRVFPALYVRWAGLDRAIARVVSHHAHTEQAVAQLVGEVVNLAGAGTELPVKLLLGEPALAVIILRTFAGQRGLHDVTDRALMEFINQCRRVERARLQVGSWSFQLEGDQVRIEAH